MWYSRDYAKSIRIMPDMSIWCSKLSSKHNEYRSYKHAEIWHLTTTLINMILFLMSSYVIWCLQRSLLVTSWMGRSPGHQQHIWVHADHEGHVFVRQDPGLPQPDVPQTPDMLRRCPERIHCGQSVFVGSGGFNIWASYGWYVAVKFECQYQTVGIYHPPTGAAPQKNVERIGQSSKRWQKIGSNW